MSDININNLIVEEAKDFKELDDRELHETKGGKSASKSIHLPYNQFPPGGAGCPACISGLDPRYNSIS